MSIKSDNWIRRMAREHKMIEPFAAEQVRFADGHKIVSYGTSSYGYDVRCANEFKIFTNINSTIVDPKAFDAKSFVDFSGDVCIIPPNSFALARTVEYFRIPRQALVVCLGKCVTGDTRVVDAETGAYVPITDMHFGRSTLAMDGWELAPAKVSAFVPQGRKPVFELRTRAGLRIRATANHPFRMLQGWVPLKDLAAGDRIAVARSIPVFGKTALPDWEASLLGLMISEGQCHTPRHSPVFTSADPALVDLLEKSVAASGLGEVTAKAGLGYRLVNHRGRGGVPELNRARAWLARHRLDVGSADKFVPQAVFTAPRRSVQRFLQALFAGDGGLYRGKGGLYLEYYSKSRRLIEDVHHLLLRFGIFSLIREKTTAIGTRACSIQITDRDQIARFAAEIGFVPGCQKQRRLEQEILPLIVATPRQRSNFDTLPREAWDLLVHAAQAAGRSCNSMGVHIERPQSVPMSAAVRVAETTGNPELSSLTGQGPLWDVVEAITPAGEEDVYDISVPRVRNFVANDVIVHNSTYARCFSGDTRVALVDGSNPTLEDLAARLDGGGSCRGFSVTRDNRVVVADLHQPRYIGRDALLEITLDDGARIRATPDHSFMKRDGQMVTADMLRPGDRLMPLYRETLDGQQFVYQPGTERLVSLQELMSAHAARHGHGVAAHAGAHIAPGASQPAYRNHRVAAVRTLPGDHDVYCLTVPGTGNFALAAGVFVHNCGIIVNVTPLEPEWEGHVTLEFSNTTPLPAKIYANEGVAQMLFFESDEVCSTSYKDRGGKYMGQQGVTLPKT
ncbi:MAG: dCTP deaminase [Proteobacteria bacterium]|nr:dCTP deaminase [Pseudomonadota bacterium]